MDPKPKSGCAMWNPFAPLAMLLLVLAVQARADAPRDGFYFGMSQSTAEKLLSNAADYELAYRVDTASTADIFARYRQHTLYLGHFLHGECVSVEKRAVVSSEARERMFSVYSEKLGRATEGSSSSDGRMHHAKWVWQDRVLELSANARADGGWLLTHKEFDPPRAREAVLAQQRELRDSRSVLDPLTGLPLEPSRTASEQAVAANTASLELPGDPAWEEALPDDADEAEEDAVDEAKTDKEKQQPAARPRITDRSDWD